MSSSARVTPLESTRLARLHRVHVRAVQFLSAVAKNDDVRPALEQCGYSAREHLAGCALLRECRTACQLLAVYRGICRRGCSGDQLHALAGGGAARFRHQRTVAINRRRCCIRDSSDENGGLFHG